VTELNVPFTMMTNDRVVVVVRVYTFTHCRHGGVEPQLRNEDGSWPKRHNESSSFLAHCRTPCLAL